MSGVGHMAEYYGHKDISCCHQWKCDTSVRRKTKSQKGRMETKKSKTKKTSKVNIQFIKNYHFNYLIIKHWIIVFEIYSFITATVWCVHTKWITRVSGIWKSVCTHRCIYETVSFKNIELMPIFTLFKLLHCLQTWFLP